MEPEYQSSWRSRCWSSRTFTPLSPFSSIAGAVVGPGFVVGFADGGAVVADGVGALVLGSVDGDGDEVAGTWLSGAGAAWSTGT